MYLLGGGAIYLLLFLYGLVIDRESTMNFVPVNSADNWLHLGLGVGMLALGVVLGRPRHDADTSIGTSQVPGASSTPRG
jgi:hypothetical protein